MSDPWRAKDGYFLKPRQRRVASDLNLVSEVIKRQFFTSLKVASFLVLRKNSKMPFFSLNKTEKTQKNDNSYAYINFIFTQNTT